MGQYNKAVLTAAGENLIARTLAGEIQLNITKAKTSNYIYPASTDFKSLTDMQGIKQTATDPVTAVYNDTMIQTRVLFSNEEIASTYYIHNIGLYAMEGTQEVLFCIVTAESPDEMPQYNGVASTSYIYNIQNVVQDAAQLNITVNPSGTATIQDVLERVDATGGDISETVIETLDTVADKYPVPAAGESVKRFFGKVLTFLRNIRPLTWDINIYVSTTGSDITGDGTSAKPYRTIQHAIDILPKDLNGYTATIQAADGTYNESIVISGFKTGIIHLRTIRDNIVSPLTKATNIICQHNSAYIVIHGFDITTSLSYGITCVHCADIMINSVRCVGVAKTFRGIYIEESGICRVLNCEISNKEYAVYITNANGYVQTSYGTGNIYGIISASAGIVHILSSSIGATTASVLQSYGGMIFYENGTQISGVYTSGLSCTWGTIQGGYIRNGTSGAAIITIVCTVILSTNLSAGTPYYISGFPRVAGISRVSVSVHDKRDIYYCFINADGTLQMVLDNALAATTYLVFNCTYMTDL